MDREGRVRQGWFTRATNTHLPGWVAWKRARDE